MNDECTVMLSAPDFVRLRSHASLAIDFACLGSEGSGDNRGHHELFSACAVSHYDLSREDAYAMALGGALSDQLTNVLQTRASHYCSDTTSEQLPFNGGWIGYISYEYGYLKETRLLQRCPEMACPLFQAGLYLWAACHDRDSDTYTLFIHPECPDATRNQIQEWLDKAPLSEITDWSVTTPFQPTQSRAEFLSRLLIVKDYIQAGDCYQANISQQFHGRFTGEPWFAFTSLRTAHPTPYSAFIRTGRQAVISMSPERFLAIHDGCIQTSPIKGTRPRGTTALHDAALAEELKASSKDRAENLMIVDLLRNDLSINSKPGSVRVEQLFGLESYENVHHLVSRIRSELKDNVSPFKAFLDAFPGGSITGAPKIRAMEIIRELEPHWRGPYCGSVFYWGLNGNLDSSIAIRTLLCKDQDIWCWGGGGIVADSTPAEEYEETLTKVRPLMDFLENL